MPLKRHRPCVRRFPIIAPTSIPTAQPATVPSVPLGLTATKDGERQIDLSWTAPSDDGGADITGYRIEVSEDGAAWSDLTADTGASETTHSHTDLNVENHASTTESRP